MMNQEVNNGENVGKLKISQEVITTIAAQAALEVPGVHALSKNSTDLRGYFAQKNSSGVVAISLCDDVAVVDIAIVMKDGFKTHDVAQKVQLAIKDAIQTMTGVAVTRVNVLIEGISYDQQGK